MGPPWRRRLAPLGPAGKAMGEMAKVQASNAPSGRNRCKRLKHEAPARKPRVWDRKLARAEVAAAPQGNVQVEHARAPAAPSTPAELPLQCFESGQRLGWLDIAFDQGDCIGEVPAGSAMGSVEHYRGGIEQAEILVEPSDCRLDHACRCAKAPMRPV